MESLKSYQHHFKNSLSSGNNGTVNELRQNLIMISWVWWRTTCNPHKLRKPKQEDCKFEVCSSMIKWPWVIASVKKRHLEVVGILE